MALTDIAIRGTKPGKRPYKVYDRNGLFLLINPSGSRLWRPRVSGCESSRIVSHSSDLVVNWFS
jgi:hypothetical protein